MGQESCPSIAQSGRGTQTTSVTGRVRRPETTFPPLELCAIQHTKTPLDQVSGFDSTDRITYDIMTGYLQLNFFFFFPLLLLFFFTRLETDFLSDCVW